MTVIRNKVDQTEETLGLTEKDDSMLIRLSAKTGQGVETLRDHLKDCMGFSSYQEGGFMARRRHLDALERASEHLLTGREQLEGYMAGEILAEELRITQQHLNEITGEFNSDDLLGKIFSSFCIGK